MEKNKILVYGASGYMGQLFLKQLKNSDLDIVLAARNDFQSYYPVRVFSLEDKGRIAAHLQDVKLVINLAGPFKNTNKPLVEACIQNGAHYIDIAGEVPEMEAVYAYDTQAQNARIMLMPGAGFGVAPTDIVANLARQKLPDATRLVLAYVTNGGASRGTLKTVLADIHKEGTILENGIYRKAMPAFKSFAFLNNNRLEHLVYNPWRADLFTAKISTGIPNIETYANFPPFIVKMMQGKLLWLRDFMLKRLIPLLPVGPSEKQIQKGSTICYAEVTNSTGEKERATIYGPEAYRFTAQILMAIAGKINEGNYQSGFQTPNLYGIELLQGIPGVKIAQ